MSLSNKTRAAIGREDLPERDDLSNALGVTTTVIKQVELSKAEQNLLQTNALTVEDDDPFAPLYSLNNENALIKPTYDPWHLMTLTHQNNTLLQCVSAMEINIDGTGYAIEPLDPTDPEKTIASEVDGEKEAKPKAGLKDKKDPKKKMPEGGKPFVPPPSTPEEAMKQAEARHAEKEEERLADEAKQEKIQEIKDEEDEVRKGIEAFFDEPWPGMSFTTLRRKIRRDLESLGNGYLEVIRDPSGKIVFLNYLDAKLVRLVRMGKPVEVEEEVTRFGKTSTVKTLKRERRYAMLIGSRTPASNTTQVMYFREFGATRQLNKRTGLWEGDKTMVRAGAKETDSRMENSQARVNDEGGKVDPADRATEVIHFTMLPDISTLYGVPRWISQMPSVLGSRKAEEQNLEFFESGGIPPVMILIQGGSLSDKARKSLTEYMSGKSKYKQRGIIAELFSTSGDISAAGNVRVSVERFGAERQQDAMFMKYDEQCQHHVRMSFRLPPLFIGDSKEHNFATAKASYMVAEAQVFGPERDEFDEVINTHVMKEIAPEWVYRSKMLSINDTTEQIKALEMAKDMVDKECWTDNLAEVAHLELECDHGEEEEMDPALEVAQRMGMFQGQPAAVQQGQESPASGSFKPVVVEGGKVGKIEKIGDEFIEELADDWADWLAGNQDFDDSSVVAMKDVIDSLGTSMRTMFNKYVAMKTLSGKHEDPDGTAELLGCAAHQMADTLTAKDDWCGDDLDESGGKLNPEQSQRKKKKKKK